MKPFYTKATTQFDNSITIRFEEREQLYPHWHFHEEYELVFIHKGSGERYVGDSINPFSSGDLVLLGSMLPHIWINDLKEGQSNSVAFTVIHFKLQFVHNDFFELSLMEDVKKLFLDSSRGISFIGFNGIESTLHKIQNSDSVNRVIAIMEFLGLLVAHQNIEYLSSKEYHAVQRHQQNDRFSKIHNYIATNFREQISLKTLAELVHMTPPAFCTYFKKKTRMTVLTYINVLKIGYSCKLLIETDLNITHIANQSGYNNTTFYNRKFKQLKGVTPKVFRKNFRFDSYKL
ncbi:AraC family transcriptional regulator [uncultured Maribacter sp.]|uniref:AraC family transcriptional regulator n=1 Tax=uncultured Maribacter sp. TaxID=431308 RepID=UPI0026018782|nr:AraC family transcriptional regulator [uncultured Maribacter sp.]